MRTHIIKNVLDSGYMRRTVREKQEKKKKRREENRIESCRAEQSRSLSSVIILFDPILVMGNAAAKALASFISCGTKDVRILMVGLDGAGKTTILYKLRLGEYVRTVPTIGFNVETVKFKNLSFTVWDVGGQDKIRHLWKQYMVNTQGLIFVIDSCDKERLKKAKQELDSLLNDPELSCVKLLVLANKQDLPSAMKATDVGERLGLSNSNSSNDSNNIRKCYIQGCSGKTGQGLNDALEWLASAMKEPNILQRVGSLRMTRSLSQSTGRLRRDGRHYLCWARRPKSCKKTLKTHQAQPQPQPQTQSCSST